MPDWHELEVPGDPIPQPRPRSIDTGHPCHVCGRRPFTRIISMGGPTGARCRRWQETVANHAKACGDLGWYAETPLVVELHFRLRPPKSLLRVNGELRGSARQYPMGARDGDWDNLGKSPSDALEGVLFDNDSRIVDSRSVKSWALGDTEPGVLIKWKEAT